VNFECVSLSFHPFGLALAAGSTEGHLLVLNAENGSAVATVRVCGSPLTCLAYNPGKIILVSRTSVSTQDHDLSSQIRSCLLKSQVVYSIVLDLTRPVSLSWVVVFFPNWGSWFSLTWCGCSWGFDRGRLAERQSVLVPSVARRLFLQTRAQDPGEPATHATGLEHRRQLRTDHDRGLRLDILWVQDKAALPLLTTVTHPRWN